jgi:hypothetical protein
MKLSALALFASVLISPATAHYIFTNINGNTAAVRQPATNSPVTDVTSTDVRCNNGAAATGIVTVAAGGSVSQRFSSLDQYSDARG